MRHFVTTFILFALFLSASADSGSMPWSIETIDFDTPQFISHCEARTLDYPAAGVSAATEMRVYTSVDGSDYQLVEQPSVLVHEQSVIPGCDSYRLILNMPPREALSVRLEILAPEGKAAYVDNIQAVYNPPLPITGTWVNLFYQDVRNKYTNPQDVDMTDPELWTRRVHQLADMGIKYLVFMAVANDRKAAYPSQLMPHCYPDTRKSPVDAIMDAAAERGLRVFMSTGWAVDQDDNLRIPEIKERQIAMMDELAALYGNHPAMWGWYLPVEDCLGPVLSQYAVDAVNSLTAHARDLTPGKKTMISPYGIFLADWDNPLFAERIQALNVDIIAYQDEVGCEREPDPLRSLRCNWPRLYAIHQGTAAEFWGNVELFAWEGTPNTRDAALIPAPGPRILDQRQAATDGGVTRIISFIVCGLFDHLP